MRKPFKTVLVGFGKISDGLREDKLYNRWFRRGTHAEILKDHPLFDWSGVVDVRKEACKKAKTIWGIVNVTQSIEEMIKKVSPEVLVLATPPIQRLDIVKKIPSLKAVLTEKPISTDIIETKKFVNYCKNNNILLQTNYWRRGNEKFRLLADKGIKKSLGNIQAVFSTYGNGILNNGTHLIDFVMMLLGPIKFVSSQSKLNKNCLSPIAKDVNVSFSLYLESGIIVNAQALDFSNYREISFDIWGTKGKLSIIQESQKALFYNKNKHRGLALEYEVSSDKSTDVNIFDPHCFYNLYSNLGRALNNKESLWSNCDNTLLVENVVEAIKKSVSQKGRWIKV